MPGTRIHLTAIFAGIAAASSPVLAAPVHSGPSHGASHSSHGMGAPQHHGGAAVGVMFFAAPHQHNGQANHGHGSTGPQFQAGGAALIPPHHQNTPGPANSAVSNQSQPNNHPHLTQAMHDFSAASKDFRAGHDEAALRELGRGLQQALSAAKNEAAKYGSAILTNHPTTHPGTPPPTSVATAPQHARTTATNGSGGASGRSGSNGGNGNSSSSSYSHLQQALQDLSSARIALRNGNDMAAQNDVHAAIGQVEQAIHSHTSNQSSGTKSASTHPTSTHSGSPTTSTSSNSQHTQQHQPSHIHLALKYMHASLRQIKEGEDGKAESEIHSAFVQLNDALQQHQQR